jgi:hypothetical protein
VYDLLEVLDEPGDKPGQVRHHLDCVEITALGGAEIPVPLSKQLRETPGGLPFVRLRPMVRLSCRAIHDRQDTAPLVPVDRARTRLIRQ